ncbi:MAG: bifunctional DNA-formamidopyrimidine glycosylase/DNA-(apurinic or apyrimidinic site) lyase, partial [Armatimonadetes bacterium]|nr:bifunctional DNA-formamidopyrimidine glycosylase/DNA-(apurinic or apyrimidinic site) lyase [Armatimonadota bacterium]
DLRPRLFGRRIESVHVLRGSVLECSARKLRAALAGATVRELRRLGKVLILDLDSGVSLLVHLRMTGQLLLGGDGPDPRFVRLVFHLAGGGRVFYADCRALGRLELCGTGQIACSRSLARFGPDALEAAGLDALLRAAQRRRTPMKCLLLDQTVLAGIGNIYASEILHVARIAPERPANTLSDAALARLGRAIRQVLAAAIEARGTTFSDFRTGTGEPGRYAARLRVYGREGERCRRRGCRGTILRIVQQQRSTFWCPMCQGPHAAMNSPVVNVCP